MRGQHRKRWTKDVPARPLPHHLDLGPASRHAGLPGNASSTSYAHRIRPTLPRRRHRRRLAAPPALVLAAGAQRRRAEGAAQGAQGHRVVYVPGNHDEFARHFVDISFGGIEIRDEAVHVTADGKRLLVIHGDLFDGVVSARVARASSATRSTRSRSGSTSWFNAVRARLGLPYWSLSQLPQAQGQERGRATSATSRRARERGAPARCRRRRVRAHPQGGNPQHRRRPLLQRRRLGREPDGARRKRERRAQAFVDWRTAFLRGVFPQPSRRSTDCASCS